MNRTWAALCATPLLALLSSHQAHAGPTQSETALRFMKASCAIANTSLEVKRTPEGRLELLITFADGQRRAVALVRSDIDTFMAGAVQLRAQESLPVIQCMDPHIDEVIATLPMLPERPGPLPAAAYVPPTLPPVAAPVQPTRPPLPASGELPVSVINGTVAPVAATAPSAMAVGARLAALVNSCKGLPGSHVQCDIKVSNRTGQDVKLLVQGAHTRLMGEEGSQSLLYSVKMGEHTHYPAGSEKELRMDLIADGSPVLQFHFYNVPEALLSIKRLEVTMGARIGTDADLQKFSFANVPIQGR